MEAFPLLDIILSSILGVFFGLENGYNFPYPHLLWVKSHAANMLLRLAYPMDFAVFWFSNFFLRLPFYFLHLLSFFILNPFSAKPIFGQVLKFYFRKFIASLVFMLERYIRRLFLEKGLKFFSYKTEKSSLKFGQMTLTLTLMLDVNQRPMDAKELISVMCIRAVFSSSYSVCFSVLNDKDLCLNPEGRRCGKSAIFLEAPSCVSCIFWDKEQYHWISNHYTYIS